MGVWDSFGEAVMALCTSKSYSILLGPVSTGMGDHFRMDKGWINTLVYNQPPTPSPLSLPPSMGSRNMHQSINLWSRYIPAIS